MSLRVLPHVYSTRAALEQAPAILPAGAVLENEVARAIQAGRATKRPLPDRPLQRGARVVWSGRGWAAEIRRCSSPGGRPAWRIVRVERDPATGETQGGT